MKVHTKVPKFNICLLGLTHPCVVQFYTMCYDVAGQQHELQEIVWMPQKKKDYGFKVSWLIRLEIVWQGFKQAFHTWKAPSECFKS